MITHRFPLDAAREAFDLVRSDTPSLKVVLEP
jgi:threonine dehydrogenase-like Zn-dependent dehydrogenase